MKSASILSPPLAATLPGAGGVSAMFHAVKHICWPASRWPPLLTIESREADPLTISPANC